MLPKRKILFVSLLLIAVFMVSTNYLLKVLTESESEVKSVEQQIYAHLEHLPEIYKTRRVSENDAADLFIENINAIGPITDVNNLWKEARSWVTKTQVVDLKSPHTGGVLRALKTSQIIRADLDTRGTQLKFLLTLDGNQDVIFKPKWYDKDTVIEGPVYAGKDRHSSEIIAFYLSVLLNTPLTPCSVERTISLTRDLLPVATKRFVNTSFDLGNRTCVYGKCFYCKREDPVCENDHLTLSGAVILNLNASFKSHRSPWQRTYKKNKQALWEQDNNYCKNVRYKLTKRRLLDLVDTSIFDFLIQNGDRHHYETLENSVFLIDNGKGFGNPHITHLDILAPLYQCCTLRSSTMDKLMNLSGGTLRKRLQSMPDVDNLITSEHLKAIEDRLLIVFATVEYCKKQSRVG